MNKVPPVSHSPGQRQHAPAVWLLVGSTLTSLVLLSGCKVGPNFHPPQAKVPAGFTGVTNAPG
ncbi:MAG TPA: hypothetical protein VNT26_07645, partial [Candidatus Sulfotelmatobacter sp.]|nr:hypothetical protein [Candidatus Sulfotelmatobacter sp.]